MSTRRRVGPRFLSGPTGAGLVLAGPEPGPVPGERGSSTLTSLNLIADSLLTWPHQGVSLAQEPGIQLSPRSQSLRVARPAWRQPSAALCPAHTGRGAGQGTSCPMPAQGQLAAGSPAQPAGDPGSCPRSAGEGPREQRGAGGCRCRIGCSWAPRPHSQAPTGRGSSSRSQGAGWAGAELPPPPGRPPPSTDHRQPALCTVL